jgi:hypothetical protein
MLIILAITGKGFARNLMALSLFVDSKTKLDKNELIKAYEILEELPKPIDEIEKIRKVDSFYDKIFTVLIISSLVNDDDLYYKKGDYHEHLANQDFENFLIKLKREKENKK